MILVAMLSPSEFVYHVIVTSAEVGLHFWTGGWSGIGGWWDQERYGELRRAVSNIGQGRSTETKDGAWRLVMDLYTLYFYSFYFNTILCQI